MKSIHLFFQNFMKCGLIGWCMEIVFTSLHSLGKRDFKLKGNTSIWMFPIYGTAAVIAPIGRLLKGVNVWIRGLTYMSLIFSMEFLSGKFLTKRGICPWDYSKSPFQIQKVIRLDYAPLWFLAGLYYEHTLLKKQKA